MYRQGDVLLVPIKTLPLGLVPVPRDSARGVVLAYGEATGHTHAIASPYAYLFRPDRGDSGPTGQDRYLSIGGSVPAALTHQEHRSIDLPSGHYRVVRQREYAPGAVPRYVAD